MRWNACLRAPTQRNDNLSSEFLTNEIVVNADESFVRYKVLVGYESVFPAHWIDRDFDYKESGAYRRQEDAGFLGLPCLM